MTRRVAFVLLAPPRPSETFIRNEILALRKHALPVHIFCLRDDAVGKIPAAVENITQILADEKMRMDLPLWAIQWAVENQPGKLSEWLSANLPDRHRDQKRRRRSLWRLGCALQIAASCADLGIEHLHAHYADTSARVALLAKRLAGITCSFTGHAKDIFTMDPDRLAKVVRGSDFAIACSEAGAHLMRNAAPDAADRVNRVYHGIDAERWRVERCPHRARPLLVAVGRLTPKKGFATLVEAIALLRDEDLPVELEIIGEGREEGSLREQIATLGLSGQVTLKGRLDQGEIRGRFAEASALVHPSVILESNNQDGVANVVLEAMAAGVPVIVSDIPALGEVVTHSETGLVFPAGDAKSLAARVRELLTDPGLQERLSEAGLSRVGDFAVEEATQRLLRLFGRDV